MNNPVRAIIVAGAFYDIAVALPLALPPVAPYDLKLLFAVSDSLGLPGVTPEFGPVHLLFISLFGVFVTAWGLFKVWSKDLRMVSLDLIMRIAVLALLFWTALTTDEHGLIYIFIAVDIVWVALNYWGHRRIALREIAA